MGYGTGTVTSVVAGAGLAGGTITTTGTVSLATQAATTLLGNYGTVSAVPSAVTVGSGLTLTTGGTLAATAGGGGSVTSVAETFTGGLITVGGSPITTAGTLTLTVAGTSGGVPYFNSGTSWASSAALTAHGVVVGGGAGTAPGSTAVGTAGQYLVSTGTADPVFQSATVVAGFAAALDQTLPAGTYDLGPFPQGGTILNGVAHVVSGGTLTYTAAIGVPGTYTAVTGLTSVAISGTADSTGTATAANVIAANSHGWFEVTNTGTPLGGSVFFYVKVP